MLTEKDIETLSAQTVETLARWWCALNAWEWPAEIPDEEPKESFISYAMKAASGQVSRRTELREWIEERVSQKLISRTWNSDMTDEEFDDFWRGNYEGDAEANERYKLYLTRQVQVRMANRRQVEPESWPEIVYDTDEWPDEIEG